MPLDPAIAPSSGTGGFGRAVAAILLAGLAILTWPAIASPAVETFGPGQVTCQLLVGTQMDCVLAANQITAGNRNVATFGLDALPPGEPALFRKWCLPAGSDCTVTVTGQRESPESARLSTVTAIRWTRLSPPLTNAAARATEKASSTGTTGPALRPVP